MHICLLHPKWCGCGLFIGGRAVPVRFIMMLSKRLPIDFIDNKELTLHSLSSHQDEPEKTARQGQGEAERKMKRKGHSQLLVNLSDTRYPIVKRVVKDVLGFKISKDGSSQEWDLMWTDNAVHPETLARMKPYQKINHFPGMFNLSRKNYLARNLIKMSKAFPHDYDFYPKTWVLPSEFNDLRQYMEEEQGAVVIAKPQASCQGRGIFLSKNIEDFSFGVHYVVQKYLKKPFLIDGLKFDLRVYVLVAGCDPLRVYIYREGLARFATEPYCAPKKENLSNLFMHLTNYAINKSNSKFQFNQSQESMDTGHKRSLTSILRRLDQQGHSSEKVWNQICELITKTLISVQPTLAHHYRSCQPDNFSNNMCFQILGFDVILDSALKPMILEVNYTPSFTADTPLDTLIKESLIRDTLELMNITNKVKNDALNLKKRELLERTLTGKKTWQSKEERDQLVQKYRLKRNRWEDKHLGNFARIYPPQDQALLQKYQSFLAHSQQCYLNVTGGNIIRNNKVSLPSHVYSETDDKNNSKAIKYTNTDQLEKIYIKKPKTMVASKKCVKNQSNLSSKNEENPTDPKRQLTHSRQFQRSKPYNSIQKIGAVRVDQKQITTEKLIGQKRSESVKNGKGLSKIYNITFKQMKVK